MTNANENEHDALARAVAGDQLALAALLAFHGPQLAKYIAYRAAQLHLPAEYSFEDVQHDVYVTVFQAIESFVARPDGSFKAWLCTIADHRMSNLCRAARRRRHRDVNHQQRLARVLSRGSQTGSPIVAQDSAAAVESEVRRLPAHYARVMRLRYVDGFTIAQIADVLDRPPKSVANSIRRAMKLLRDALGSTSRYV